MTAISKRAAILASTRMQLLLLRRSRVLYAALVLALVPPLAAAVLLGWQRGVLLFDDVIQLDVVLLPLAAALLVAPVLADELGRQTFSYLACRPAPRYALLVGRFLVAGPALALLFAVATVLAYLVAGLTATRELVDYLPHLGQATLAVALATLVYAALAAGLGAVFPRHPLAAMVGWVAVVELGIGSLSGSGPLSFLSIAFHLRSLAGLPAPRTELGFSLPVSTQSPVYSVLALVAIAVLAGVAGGWRIAGVEPGPDENG
jgi:ABC-type transport system involved in multi-copper enzyme maturation permease subunit